MKEGESEKEWKRRIRRERKGEKGKRETRRGSRGSAGKGGKVHDGLMEGREKGIIREEWGGDRTYMNDRWRDRLILKDEKRDEKRMRNWLPCGAILN